MAARDECSDTGRIGDGSQVKGNKGGEYRVPIDFAAIKIDEERARGGFTKTAMPVGQTPPAKGWTPGNYGGDNLPGGTDMEGAAQRAKVLKNGEY